MNAFNGANFDHYEFFRITLGLGRKPDKFLMNNGSITSAKIKNLHFFDLAKMTSGSLRKNLEDFKCQVKKGDCDHNSVPRGDNPWELMKFDCDQDKH